MLCALTIRSMAAPFDRTGREAAHVVLRARRMAGCHHAKYDDNNPSVHEGGLP
jgi:hypothetical protein